jgi:hypothetical protein
VATAPPAGTDAASQRQADHVLGAHPPAGRAQQHEAHAGERHDAGDPGHGGGDDPHPSHVPELVHRGSDVAANQQREERQDPQRQAQAEQVARQGAGAAPGWWFDIRRRHGV